MIHFVIAREVPTLLLSCYVGHTVGYNHPFSERKWSYGWFVNEQTWSYGWLLTNGYCRTVGRLLTVLVARLVILS